MQSVSLDPLRSRNEDCLQWARKFKLFILTQEGVLNMHDNSLQSICKTRQAQ